MDVTIEMPGRRLRADATGADLARALRSGAAGIAYALAMSIKRRVSIRGDTGQPRRSYSTHVRRYVSPRYPVTGGKIDRTGSRMFKHSAAFHSAAGTKPGTYNVNKGAGMWSGLSVQVLGERKSRILFRGRSEGQGMQWGTYTKGVKAEGPHWRILASGKKRAKPRKVSNALKAATVWASHRISLLAPSQDEMNQIARAQVAIIQKRGLVSIAGYPVGWTEIPADKFLDLMTRAQLGRVR